MEVEHLELMLEARGSEILDRTTYEQFLKNMSYLHQYSLENQKLALLQGYKIEYIIGNGRVKELGLEPIIRQSATNIYVMYPMLKYRYHSRATNEALKVGELTNSELQMAIKLGVVYVEGNAKYNSILRMWGINNTEQIKDRLQYKIDTPIKFEELTNKFMQYVSGGIHIVTKGIPIELKGEYNKEKDCILIKETINQSSKIQALINGMARASLSRITSNGKLYQGAFKGWTIDGTEMLNISDSSARAVAESVTFVVLNRLNLNTSDCDLNFISGWQGAGEESRDGMKYIDSLLGCIVTISHRLLSIIESILNIQSVDEIALEMQEERTDTFLSTAEANVLRYNLGID